MKVNRTNKTFGSFGRRIESGQSAIELSGNESVEHVSSGRIHTTKGNKKIFRFGPIYYDFRDRVLQHLFHDIGHDQYDRISPNELETTIKRHIKSTLAEIAYSLSPDDLAILGHDLVNDVIGYGPLEDLLKEENITDIMVIGPKSIFYEEAGRIHQAKIAFENEAHVRSIGQRIARRIGRRIDESSPMCDARLPDGSRVNIVVPPLSIDGTAITIRKFQTQRLNFENLISMGTISYEAVEFLKWMVRIRCNILVIGGTGSGKTTLLNGLIQSLSSEERIVTCEDAAELQLQQPHIVRLETRSSNLEGAGEIPMRSLIRNSLRMRPDRIIVGEIRGEEAFDFIQAMNTGHDGSMGTMHANSALDAISRLEGLISLGAPSLPSRTIQQMITSALDIIIEVRRMADGSRRIVQIIEILNWSDSGISTRCILEDRTGSESTTSESHHGTFVTSIRIIRKSQNENIGIGHQNDFIISS